MEQPLVLLKSIARFTTACFLVGSLFFLFLLDLNLLFSGANFKLQWLVLPSLLDFGVHGLRRTELCAPERIG